MSHKSIHGPAHWRRVERNGLWLAERVGADCDVIRLFALFHDCRRTTDSTDPGHGARGAAFAAELRGRLFDLSEASFALLRLACVEHTDGKRHADPTVGACWDADRLDIGRAGLVLHPRYMSTEFGLKIAANEAAYPFAATPTDGNDRF